MRSTISLAFVTGLLAVFPLACSGDGAQTGENSGGRSGVGGASTTLGGANTTGGAAGGTVASAGGALGTGGSAFGGAVAAGGSGGNEASGGKAATNGGAASGGAGGNSTASGGAVTGGRNSAAGGSASGGTNAAAGGSQSGGATTGGSSSGGKNASGGAPANGGAATGGAASGGAASGGNGGATGYQPCPASPCKIMPFGDSITFGVGDEGNAGYRGPLFASIVAAGQKVTFTGSVTNGPTTVSGQSFPRKNEGHSGWGISRVNPNSGGNVGITTVIPNPGFSSNSGGIPNIILLHIGTNDQGTYSAAQMTQDLGGLLDKLISNAPDALIVVAQIIPLGYGTNDVIKTYNQSIPGLVQQRASAGKHVVLVDMFTGFTAASMLATDKVHPNSTGYKFMADHFYSAIKALLPK